MYYIIILLFLAILLSCNKENFTGYIKNPFNYKEVGTSPLVFYNKPLYRKPYRYPFSFKTTYPIEYMRYH